MNKTWIIFTMLLIAVASAYAQDQLTLEDARLITLENNFGIKIAENNVKISQNLTDKKLNNYLPTLSANGGVNGSFGGSAQQFNNGSEANTNNALTLGANASLNADYTIYDKRRSLTLEQLEQSVLLSDIQLRQTVEQSLFQVYISYYTVAQLTENIEALENTIEISESRRQRAKYELDLGRGNGLAVLNAQVDIQRDSINLINALTALDIEKRNLNTAMGRDSDTPFDLITDTELNEILELENIPQNYKSNNTALQINEQNQIINSMDLDLIEVENKPIIVAGAAYNLSLQDNPSQAFITSSNSRGFTGNIGINWPIYDASRDIRKQNVAIALTNQKLQKEQLQQEIERDLINGWTNYNNALKVVTVEQYALSINEENFNRTKELFNAGQVNSIEFRQAQLNLLTAKTNLNNAIYNVHLSEIQLKLLSGTLISL